MSGLPYIAMTGGLIETPELRFTPGGVAVVNFRLASKKRVKDASGQWTDGDPIYMNVSAWRDLAEHVAESLVRPGQKVTVTGHLAQQWWEDKAGVKQSKYVVEADSIALDLTFSTYDEKPDPKKTTPAAGDPFGPPATEPPPDEPPF